MSGGLSPVPLPIGHRWPKGAPLAEKQAKDTWRFVGADRARLTLPEANAARAEPMPNELAEAIEEVDAPPAMCEARRIAAFHSRREFTEIEGAIRFVRWPNGSEGETKTCPLIDGYICDVKRTTAFKRPAETEAPEDDSTTAGETKTRKRRPWRAVNILPGLPKLLAVFRAAGDAADHEVLYLVEYRGQREYLRFNELANGSAWRVFPGAALTDKRQHALAANLIKAQIEAFDVPIIVLRRRMGWHAVADGDWRYFYEDGHFVAKDGLGGSTDPDGRVFVGRIFPEPLRDRFSRLPEIVSRPLTAAAIKWLFQSGEDIDPGERLTVDVPDAARSIVSTFVGVGRGVIKEGPGGCGKSTSVNSMRCIAGPYDLKSPPDASFYATMTGMELAIGHLADRPIHLDDYRPDFDPAQLKALDPIVGSIAEGVPIKQRGTKYLSLHKGTVVSGLPAITANSTHNVDKTRQRRITHVLYAQDDLDISALRDRRNFDRRAETMTCLGFEILQRVAVYLSENGEAAFRELVRQWDDDETIVVREIMRETRPLASNDLAWSLSANWAKALSGARLIEWAIPEAAEVYGIVLGAVHRLAIANLDTITNGGSGAARISPEQLSNWLRQLLGSGQAFVLDKQGEAITAQLAAKIGLHPSAFGYTPDREAWAPRAGAVHIGYVDLDEAAGAGEAEPVPVDEAMAVPGKILLLPNESRDLLGKAAAREKVPVPDTWTRQKFSGEMVRVGWAEPGKDQAGSPMWLHGKTRRVLVVSLDDLFGDAPIEDIKNGSKGSKAVRTEKNPRFSAVETSLHSLTAANSPAVRAVRRAESELAHPYCLTAPLKSAVRAESGGNPSKLAHPYCLTALTADFGAPIGLDTELLELGERLSFPRLAGLGTGTWSVIPAGAAGWREFATGSPQKISIAIESARRRLAAQEPPPAAPEPATEAKANGLANDGSGENRAPAGAAEALAPTTEANKPGETGGRKSYPATQGKKSKAGSVKRPPGILMLEAEATWLGTNAVAGIEAIAAVQREKRRKRPMSIEAVLDRARELGAEQVALHRTWTAAASLPQIFQRGDAASPYLPSGGISHSWATTAPGSAWTLTHPGRLLSSIWARHKGGGPPIEILIPQYAQTAWCDAADSETLAHALVAYRNATADNGRAGFGYRNSAGNTFIRMWRALTRDRGAADVTTDLIPSAYPEPAHAVPEAVADLAYSRLPMGAEANASSCVVIDGSSQYLRVLDINCGAGSIEHLSGAAAGGESFKRPGWWRVRYRMPPAWPDTLPVPGWPLAPNEEGWLVSETLAFLADPAIGAEIEIFEAYLWSRSTRALARLQRRLRDGRLYLITQSQDASLTPAERAGAGLALKAAKDTYKAGVGWFSRVSNRDKTELIDYHRPHWRHAIIARSTVAVLRDIFGAYQRTGLAPSAIAVDGLGYMTDLPAEQLAAHLGLPIGLGLGQYKHSHVVPGASMLRALAAADGAAMGLITGTKEADDGADA